MKMVRFRTFVWSLPLQLRTGVYVCQLDYQVPEDLGSVPIVFLMLFSITMNIYGGITLKVSQIEVCEKRWCGFC